MKDFQRLELWVDDYGRLIRLMLLLSVLRVCLRVKENVAATCEYEVEASSKAAWELRAI